MKNLTVTASIIIVCFITSLNVFAQDERSSSDHLFPKKGSSLITIGTGIPYVGVAEYAYGVTNGFSIGVIGGFTPLVPGFGLRLRGVIYENSQEDYRLTLRAPTFYYPATKGLGGEPWWLTYPVLASEWKLQSGVRVSAEVGVMAAICAHAVSMALFNYGDHEMQEMGFEGAVYHTFGGGVAVPLSEEFTLQSNLNIIMDGGKLVNKNSAVESPILLTLAVSYAL